jgi:type III pantothenate kinase
MAGRLDWLKGFDLVVRSLARLRDAHPDAHVRIAGTGQEDELLRVVARSVGVADRVELLGPCGHTEVLDEIAQASVVAVPSRAIEGFSLVALEAAHVGRPVVAAGVGGLTETVVDGVTGLIVPPDDLAALTAALGGLLADPHRAAALGAAARDHARRYDATHCARAYASIYDQLTDASGLLAASPTRTS